MLATSGVERMVRVWSSEAPRDRDDCDEYPIDDRSELAGSLLRLQAFGLRVRLLRVAPLNWVVRPVAR